MRAGLVVVAAAAVALVWYLRRGGDDHATAAPTAAVAAAPPAPAPAAAKPRPNDRVKTLTPPEREAIAKQIRDARAGRAATAAPAGPSLPAPAPSRPPTAPALDPGDLESFKTTMRGAMKEVVPYLAGCYDAQATKLPDEITVRAELTLTGDPDIGTLIDTQRLSQPGGAALDETFDTCLRDALAGLELPPLAEGEEIRVTYPFLFTR